MNYYLSIISSVFLLNVVPSCQNTVVIPQDQKVKLELTAQQGEKVKQDNFFTFDLLSGILSEQSDKENVMLSPLSVNMTLSMTANALWELPKMKFIKHLDLKATNLIFSMNIIKN